MSKNDETKSLPVETPSVNPAYFLEGKSWEDDRYRSMKRQRNLALFGAGVSSAVAVTSLVSLSMLLPLKEVEPYLVTVDKTSGYTEIVRALKPGEMSQNEAVTSANIVRYVKARETFDAREMKSNFDLAQLYSTGNASKDLTWLYTPANPQSLDKVNSRGTTVSVEVKSVSLLNSSTASVRFATTTRRDSSISSTDWVAVVKFRYTSTPMKNAWRFDNPLGFQVTDYRRDQESAPTMGSLQ